ncbi:MAG: PQQ-dependent sugar dehydrogenase [Acidobacteriota bacterium]
MDRTRIFAAVACAATLVGCGGSKGKPPDDGGGGGGPIAVSALVGWDMLGIDAATRDTLRFALYLDNARSELAGATCTASGADGLSCSGPLPAMTAGTHTIELASYTAANPTLESPRSTSLSITVSSSGGVTTAASSGAASTTAVAAPPTALTTADGARLRIDVYALVDSPTAIAISNSGVAFIGHGAGRVGVVRNGVLFSDDTVGGSESGGPILDLAVDPSFARNHFVYVLDVTPGESATFRLARYREAAGRLGERAVLLGGVPASPTDAAGALAFGADAQLYVALDDGGDPERAGQLASYNGKVLRLNADGSTPADQSGASPVYASNLRSPRSLSSDETTASLWVADRTSGRAVRLAGAAERDRTARAFALPLEHGPASVAMYRGALIPALRGSLLVAPAVEDGFLLRARFTGADQRTIAATERLAIPGGARARFVETGPEGAIYVGTDREVLRISPR